MFDTDMRDVAALLGVMHGYSGGGTDKTNARMAACKNNPSMQNVAFGGPIPEGMYTAAHRVVQTRTHGPDVIWLTPDATNKMYGRAGFGEHGDSIIDPGWASDGCIIQAHPVRLAHDAVIVVGDNRVKVVAYLPPPPVAV